MSAPIPTGTVLTYTSGDWMTDYLGSPDAMITKVSQLLMAEGIKVVSSSANVGILQSVGQGVLTGYISFGVTLQVQTIGGLGYNSPNDVGSIIDHDAYVASGHYPANSSIPSFSLPQNSSVAGILSQIGSFLTGKQSTGQPAAPSSGGSWLDNITSKGTLYIALAIFGFVGALLLIGYSGALREHV